MIVNKIQNINTVKEFEAVLDMVSKCADRIFFCKYDYKPILNNAYVEITESKIKITYKLYRKKITYVFDRNLNYQSNTTVISCMSRFAKAHKIQRVEEILKIKPEQAIGCDGKKMSYRFNIGSASPHKSANNKKYGGKSTVAWEYDLHHAYGLFLKQPLPDITTCRYNAVIKENQVGFTTVGATKTGTGNQLIMLDKPGLTADYVFDLMESPYIDYVDRIEKQLAEETDENKRTDLKNNFRYVVGELQNINPYWRAMIVERCNKLVKSLIDSNTIYSNTDSIVSAVQRIDIESNAKLSIMFAKKRSGEIFRLHKTSMIYQWNEELPKVGGITKRRIEHYNKTHNKPWLLNENELPKEAGALYSIAYSNHKLTLVENYKE